jgi:hypothetical protein
MQPSYEESADPSFEHMKYHHPSDYRLFHIDDCYRQETIAEYRQLNNESNEQNVVFLRLKLLCIYIIYTGFQR